MCNTDNFQLKCLTKAELSMPPGLLSGDPNSTPFSTIFSYGVLMSTGRVVVKTILLETTALSATPSVAPCACGCSTTLASTSGRSLNMTCTPSTSTFFTLSLSMLARKSLYGTLMCSTFFRLLLHAPGCPFVSSRAKKSCILVSCAHL